MIRGDKGKLHDSSVSQSGKAPRLLVIAGVPPGNGCVGEIILKDICLQYPAGHIVCVSITGPRYVYSPPAALEALPVYIRRRPYDFGNRVVGGRLGTLASFLTSQVLLKKDVNAHIRAAVAIGRKNRIDKVLMVLDSTTTIAMGAEVARQLSVPLLTLVWDAPEYLLVQRKLDSMTRRQLLRRFGDTLNQSERVAVVSETMQKDYQKDYGARTIIVRHGLELDDSQKRVETDNPQSSEFIIGFAGGLYAHSAWEALLQTLADNDWQVGGRRVVLKVMGWKFHFRTKEKMNIHFLGWQSPEEAAEILSRCDVNYLPHPFEPELHYLAHYSFPTKLSTYLATGRPVFVHAPPQSALAPFCSRNQVGVLCESLDSQEIMAGLKRLASDPDYYSVSCRQAKKLARTEFNQEHFLRSFFEFVGTAP